MTVGDPHRTTGADRAGVAGAGPSDRPDRRTLDAGSETEWGERLMRQVLREFATVVLLDDVSHARPAPASRDAAEAPTGTRDRFEQYARDMLGDAPYNADRGPERQKRREDDPLDPGAGRVAPPAAGRFERAAARPGSDRGTGRNSRWRTIR